MRTAPSEQPVNFNDLLLLDTEFDELGGIPIEDTGSHGQEDEWDDESLMAECNL